MVIVMMSFMVSIRAPREGGDPGMASGGAATRGFNPRPP